MFRNISRCGCPQYLHIRRLKLSRNRCRDSGDFPCVSIMPASSDYLFHNLQTHDLYSCFRQLTVIDSIIPETVCRSFCPGRENSQLFVPGIQCPAKLPVEIRPTVRVKACPLITAVRKNPVRPLIHRQIRDLYLRISFELIHHIF